MFEFEEHYTLPQIARQTGLSESLLRNDLGNRPGVFRLEHPGRRGKRAYTIFRVPKSVFQGWYAERTGGVVR